MKSPLLRCAGPYRLRIKLEPFRLSLASIDGVRTCRATLQFLQIWLDNRIALEELRKGFFWFDIHKLPDRWERLVLILRMKYFLSFLYLYFLYKNAGFMCTYLVHITMFPIFNKHKSKHSETNITTASDLGNCAKNVYCICFDKIFKKNRSIEGGIQWDLFLEKLWLVFCKHVYVLTFMTDCIVRSVLLLDLICFSISKICVYIIIDKWESTRPETHG